MLKKLGTLVGAIAVSSVALAASAEARTHDDRAVFRFPSPVSIPGGTLPAGEYIFRVVDPDTGRSVVQVLDLDGRVHGMFFTQRTQRALPAETAEVSLGEARAGDTPSIGSWWQPGELHGREFMYRPGEASWARESMTSRVSD